MRSFDEVVAQRKATQKKRKKPSNEEHRIQSSCVSWFKLQYRNLRGRLIAVPNGGKRDETTASNLIKEGVVSGVSDLILLKPKGGYGALLIEMKTAKGTQSPSQKDWQKNLCAEGEYKYVICRSLEDFMREVNGYLKMM